MQSAAAVPLCFRAQRVDSCIPRSGCIRAERMHPCTKARHVYPQPCLVVGLAVDRLLLDDLSRRDYAGRIFFCESSRYRWRIRSFLT